MTPDTYTPLPPKKKNKNVLYIAGALALLVVFAGILIISVMKRNPLENSLLPEPGELMSDLTTSDEVVMNEGVTVERIDVVIQESFPVQVRALVHGNLSDGCVRIVNTSSARNNSTFTVNFETVRQGDMCTQALVPFEQSVALDVAGLKAGTYTVSVAGATTTFRLDQDNALEFQSEK